MGIDEEQHGPEGTQYELELAAKDQPLLLGRPLARRGIFVVIA